ncbi:glutamate-gated chloride channel alpha-like isoform X1 [Palaemon carinicauda]|uniref:glutamate-gated chloride channel alpha-like isoform X1 n=1 Tax=Palaemon carinicauda TaxID=392227 RepID=UPI0035B62F98
MKSLLVMQLIVLLFLAGCVKGITQQRQILENLLATYDVNEWPDADFDRPTDVSVQMFINSFGSLNAANMDYSIDVFLRQHWVDSRLQHSRNRSITIRDPDMQKRIWRPDTYFHNVKDAEFHVVTMPNIQFRIDGTGHILYSVRVTAELSCNLKLEHYPFDEQSCLAHLSSYASTDEIVNYHWVEGIPIDLPDDLEIAQFDLLNYYPVEEVMPLQTGNFSSLKVDFQLRRQNGYHILQTYVPTVLIVSISWVSFWLDPTSVPGRVSIGVTTLLTLTTLAGGIRQQLPPVSYIKAIDVWVGMCMIMVFGALLEFTLVNWLANKKLVDNQTCKIIPVCKSDEDEEAPKTYVNQAHFIDRISRGLFPGSFLLFNLIYWPYYLSNGMHE